MYFVSLMSMIYSFASKIKQNLCDFSSVHYTLILPPVALPFCVSHFLFLTEANQFGYLSQQKYCQRIMLQKKTKERQENGCEKMRKQFDERETCKKRIRKKRMIYTAADTCPIYSS